MTPETVGKFRGRKLGRSNKNKTRV